MENLVEKAALLPGYILEPGAFDRFEPADLILEFPDLTIELRFEMFLTFHALSLQVTLSWEHSTFGA